MEAHLKEASCLAQHPGGPLQFLLPSLHPQTLPGCRGQRSLAPVPFSSRPRQGFPQPGLEKAETWKSP